MKILFPQNPRKRILIPKTPRNKKMDSSLSPNPGDVKRVGNWKPYRRAWDACNGTTTVFFNHLAWLNNTSSNYDWPLCCTRSQIWRIHFWNWWSHGVTQCESLTPINIQWELWPFSKFVTWPWGQLYIYFFTICSRRYILEMQNFFWIVIVSISCWRYLILELHTYMAFISRFPTRGRSQTTLTRFCPLLTTYWHWERNLFIGKYANRWNFKYNLPCLVNVVCECPFM